MGAVASIDAWAFRRSALPGTFVAVGLAAALVVALGGVVERGARDAFVIVFTSIVVEALPFILMGAAVSALIEVAVPVRWFEVIARLPLPLQLPGAALGGMLFPVCECGSVPVARRLMLRGMHPAAGLAFMLGSPIVNPIVLLSTWVAYAGRGLGPEMVLGRAVLGLTLALVAGWALGGDGAAALLRGRAAGEGRRSHERESRPPGERDGRAPYDGGRRAAFVEHLAGDFFFMGRFVVFGAALAALLQTVVPQGIVSGVAHTPVVGALALMGIAFVLSLCSEADAFVAVSFTPFPLGAHMAFLVFGPVVDAKLAFLYGATFRRRFVARLIVVAVPVALAGSLWFEALIA